MAGDWIKMTHALPEKPEVLAIAGMTRLSRHDVVGRLFILWRWFDNHTLDGNAPGVTSVTLNECLFGYQDDSKFVAAVVSTGWLVESERGISVVKFDEHISESAKTRAQTAKRVARSKQKSNAESVTSPSPTALPREEKRREEIKSTDATASGAAKPPRGSRKCPASFDPVETADAHAWTAEHTPDLDWRAETDKFRDHTFKNPITDWSGAWRNWMRRAFEDRPRGRGGAQQQPTFRERDEARAAARVHEMTGGLVSAKPEPITRRNDALQEIFDAPARRIG